MALAVGDRLFRRSVHIDCARDGAVRRVDHGGIRRAVAPDVDAVVERVEHNAVGSALDFDGLDGLERLGVPHDHRIAADEAVVGFGVDRRAMAAGIGDFAGRFERIEVENRDSASRSALLTAHTRDVQTASGIVGVHIVETAVAAHFGRLENLIGARSGSVLGQNHAGRDGQRENYHRGKSSHTAPL